MDVKKRAFVARMEVDWRLVFLREFDPDGGTDANGVGVDIKIINRSICGDKIRFATRFAEDDRIFAKAMACPILSAAGGLVLARTFGKGIIGRLGSA